MRNLSDYSKRPSVKPSSAKINVSQLCGEIITELVAGVSCPGSGGRTGRWVPAPGLPPGWRSLAIPLAGKQKQMFQSPNGDLFHSRQAVDKFLDNEKKLSKAKEKSASFEAETDSDCSTSSDGVISLSDDFEEESEEAVVPPAKRRRLVPSPGAAAVGRAGPAFTCSKPRLDRAGKAVCRNILAGQETLTLLSLFLAADVTGAWQAEERMLACYEQWPVLDPATQSALVRHQSVSRVLRCDRAAAAS